FFAKNIANPKNVANIIEILTLIINNYRQCPVCFCLQTNGECAFCPNNLRDKTKICIVANLFDVNTFEKTKFFNGVYHVLNGEINVKNGITTDKITFDELEKRMNDKIIKEVIIAVSSTFEGEITAQYLKTLLAKYDVKISRLARGIPIGGSLDYIDET